MSHSAVLAIHRTILRVTCEVAEGKESAQNVGYPGLIPGSGRSPREENGNPLHSSILAWRIPWTEEPGGLQSLGSQRVGHD